jgi:hypothetical protein
LKAPAGAANGAPDWKVKVALTVTFGNVGLTGAPQAGLSVKTTEKGAFAVTLPLMTLGLTVQPAGAAIIRLLTPTVAPDAMSLPLMVQVTEPLAEVATVIDSGEQVV